MQAVLQATGVRKRFGGRDVLAGVDLALQPGTVTVVLGENGAGKTTLLRVLAGDAPADGGTVQIQGVSLVDEADRARAGLIYVAQHPPLAPLLTLREHAQALTSFRDLAPAEADADLQRLSRALHLHEALDRPVRALSGGMAHKAALVLALMARTPLVLLDEPHSGLDVRSALALRGLIAEARAAGTAFLLASHLAEATLALADRALVLARGDWTLDLDAQALAAFGGDARRFEAQVLAAMG
jgi:ABC-2 type transport system ATP-binding protein